MDVFKETAVSFGTTATHFRHQTPWAAANAHLRCPMAGRPGRGHRAQGALWRQRRVSRGAVVGGAARSVEAN